MCVTQEQRCVCNTGTGALEQTLGTLNCPNDDYGQIIYYRQHFFLTDKPRSNPNMANIIPRKTNYT